MKAFEGWIGDPIFNRRSEYLSAWTLRPDSLGSKPGSATC